VAPERQSSIDAHIRSRIQVELEHLRKEEEHVRREIESTLEKENLDRERAMAGVPESEATVGTLKSSTALSEDLEQIRSKIDRFHPRKRLELFPHVKSAGETVLSCYK
jgi:MICOS complex subunit MIC19